MDEPVALKVVSTEEPNMEIVHRLEELLGAAMVGEVVAFGVVAVRRGGLVTTGWSGAENGHTHNLLSGAALLQYRIAKDAAL